MPQPGPSETRQRMTITGDLDTPSILPWINRYAAKLGLVQAVAFHDETRIDLDLIGAEDLIDMMEVGCSLGPIDVWVESVERKPLLD